MKLHVELSATVSEGNTTETCNTNLDAATEFSVYIGNPQAFHIQDFKIDRSHGFRHEMIILAYKEAYQYALTLAKHLDCALEIKFRSPNPLEEFITALIRQVKEGGVELNPFQLTQTFEEKYDIKPHSS